MIELLHCAVASAVIIIVYIAFPSLRAFLSLPVLAAVFISAALLAWQYFALPQLHATAERFFAGFHVGGHRGAPKLAPENTIESFKEAREARVDLVEFDLALSKDGVAVLMHDDDLKRTCGEEGLVSSFTAAQIATKNAASTFKFSSGKQKECRVPTLAETVDFCRSSSLKMLFDVKDSSHEMVSQIVDVISRHNLYDQVIVSSFFPWVPYAVKKADPKILTGVTWRPYFISYSDLEGTEPRFGGVKHYLAYALDWVNVQLLHWVLPQFLGVEMILTQEGDIHRSLVEDMKRKNVQVVAWTVNDERQMIYLVDSLKVPILTDVPQKYAALDAMRKQLA